MAKYEYTRFKIRIAPDSKKRQGLRVGDVVRRQYVDGASVFYSLMVVLATGEDTVELTDGKCAVSPYFIGGLIEGDAPRDGELLDFMRVTSLTDERRSGALYLTASDDEAPYLDVIDGMGTERSLCRPSSLAEYSNSGGAALECGYAALSAEASRIVGMTRTSSPADGVVGLKIPITTTVAHPQRLVISYRIRASKALHGVSLSFGYTNGQETDGSDSVEVVTGWQYRLTLITVDFPAQYPRSLTLDLTAHLEAGDWCEVADLNVCLLEHLATFEGATKARVGKITGISDPLFGMLQGYGAYFQRLYATHDVNVAGTLTAGDEAGFGSTFYVGRIHKNCFVNSLEPAFQPAAVLCPDVPPAGIGKCFRIAADETKVSCQAEAWTQAHAGERYCFSFWARNDTDTVATLRYGTTLLREIAVGREWKRYHAVFALKHMAGSGMYLSLSGAAGCLFSSPQLECGEIPSLYQPTDQTLDETEAFGAWLCRGGIGGTIQNPLLKLNADGSICSADGSFVINRDGSGHFSGGRFRWTKDEIVLQGVTIRWEDLDETVQEQIKARTVSIEGGTIFHYPDELSGSQSDPASIVLTATERNFTGTSCLWEYLSSDGVWKKADGLQHTYTLTPDFHGWEERRVLTLRFSSVAGGESYSATHTVFKHYDGVDSYSLYVESEQGTVFRNGAVSTTLRARVFKGGTEVTEHIAEGCFRWTRTSRNAEDDALWNEARHWGRTLEITEADVWHKAVFNCEAEIL